MDLPRGLSGHPLLRHNLFYTLPLALWDALKSNLGGDCFDPEHLAIEREVSRIVGDHTTFVGFERGRKLSYCLLRPSGPLYELAKEYIRQFASDPEADIKALEEGEKRISRLQRAFLGWLLTNREFVAEHDAVMLELRESSGPSSIPQVVPPTTQAFRSLYQLEKVQKKRRAIGVQSLQQFLNKWQLQTLTGPYLPFPMPMELPAILTNIGLSRARAMELTVAIIPDTMPLPGDAELRRQLETARGKRSRPHLQQWQSIIAASNPAKSELDPFARQFEIQHYVRILYPSLPSSREQETSFAGSSCGILAGQPRYDRSRFQSHLQEARLHHRSVAIFTAALTTPAQLHGIHRREAAFWLVPKPASRSEAVLPATINSRKLRRQHMLKTP